MMTTPRSPRIPLLGLLLLSAAACTSTPASEGAETSTASSSETETGDPSACPMEFTQNELGATELPPPFVACELPMPCNEVVFEMVGSGGTDGGDENQTPAALGCVLSSLATGEAGQFDLIASASGFSAEVQIRVYGDQRAEWSYLGFDDKWYTQSRTPAKIDPAYFEGAVCNATTTWYGVWSCIQEGLQPCETWGVEATLCPE